MERPGEHPGERPGDRHARPALHRQLYDQIRDLVLSGRLSPGTRLPSSRGLGKELGCSRNTVLTAFEQLLAEGYLEGHPGSGTYVSRVLPDQLLAVRGAPAKAAPALGGAKDPGVGDPGAGDRARPGISAKWGLSRRIVPVRSLSRRGQSLAGLDRGARFAAGAFVPGVPDLEQFPFEVWGRLLGRVWRRPGADLLRPEDPAGHEPLRRAIADYLRAVRALRCDWRQVLITSGAQQALDLAVRILTDPGAAVWVEEPGYPGLRGPLIAAGAELVPVTVDGDGLSVAAGKALAPEARLAVVTPSHQYPLGVTMSLTRRLELLDWAREADAWILEDDYDSEYRYAGRPLAALQGLDRDGRVVYLGTFSKVLFPGLRLGYLVAPPDLAAQVTRARAALDDHPSTISQPALAAFIEGGHFAAHLRRMRKLYGRRQEVLVASARRHLPGLLEVAPDPAGLHVAARLAPDLSARMSDREAETRAAAAGLAAPALSRYFLGAPSRQGLLLGYAALSEAEIARGVKVLAAALSGGAG